MTAHPVAGWHLAARERSGDADPAGDGCSPDCPRLLHEETRLLRSVVNSLVHSVEGDGYVVLANGGRALRFAQPKHAAIRRARDDAAAWQCASSPTG